MISQRISTALALLVVLGGCGTGNVELDRSQGATTDVSSKEVSEIAQLSSTSTTISTPSDSSSSPSPSVIVPSTSTAPPTSTTTPTTTLPSLESAGFDRSQVPSGTPVLFGYSVLKEPLFVTRHGDRDGARLLLVGSIHGDEDAGIAIVNALMERDVPAGVELWLVPSMNPDGNISQERHNVNGVDLNRNFPHRWAPLAEPGNWQYAGPSSASEPETAAMVALGELVNPDLVLWYHQDLFRISPTSGRNGEIRALYAEISGLPLLQVSGGTYTGTASMWSRTVTTSDGTGFTVELGPSLSDNQLEAHVSAVLAVAKQFYAS